MDGIEGLLARDFGVRPQGKAAPMAGASSRSTESATGSSAAAWASYGRSTPAPSYDDLFGSPAPAASAPPFDSLFDSFKGPTTAATKSAAPSPGLAYDDDIFDAVPGLRSSNSASAAPRYDDGVFGSSTAAPAYDDVFGTSARSAAPPPPAYDDDLLAGFGSAPPRTEEKRRPVVVDDDGDDLLGAFGRSPSEERRKPVPVREERLGSAGFDDLIPGFAGSSPPRSR